MLVVAIVGGWILVAAVCAVVLGRSVRSAELRRRPAVPVVLRDKPRETPGEERGYVQTSLFDPTSLHA